MLACCKRKKFVVELILRNAGSVLKSIAWLVSRLGPTTHAASRMLVWTLLTRHTPFTCFKPCSPVTFYSLLSPVIVRFCGFNIRTRHCILPS